VRQIVDVACGVNTFRALGSGTFQNVRGYLSGTARKRILEFPDITIVGAMRLVTRDQWADIPVFVT
jgi:hypothetical protein